MSRIDASSQSDTRGRVTLADSRADGAVVWLQGDHDLSNANELWQTMIRTIGHDDADLVIDLSGVQFMSAATVGIIAKARDLLEGQSRRVQLRSPSKCAHRLLELCGLAELIDVSLDGPATVHTHGALHGWVVEAVSDLGVRRADSVAAASTHEAESGRTSAAGCQAT